MRFDRFSRGVFESQSLTRKSREWGKGPTKHLLLLGAVLAIGGGTYAIKLRSNTGLAYGGRGSGSDFISPLPSDEYLSEGVTGVGEIIEGDGKREAEEGTEESFGNGQDNGTGTEGQGLEAGNSEEGLGRTSGESSQGSQVSGGDGGEVGSELGEAFEGSVPEAGQEAQQEEKEKIKAYLQEKSSPLGDYVDVLYEEELNANLSGLSRLVVAIAGAEQNFGKVPNFNNLWGIKCGSTTYCRYVSLEEGIKAIVSLLRKPLYGLNGQVREEDIWRIAGTYAESDRWPQAVVYFWKQLEGR